MSTLQIPGIPTADPSDVGLCPERLKRLDERLQAGVQRGEIPGAVLTIGRQGRIGYQRCFGMRDPQAQSPMRSDSIFRIASMTKPITSMAAMMLVEEGRLSLADEVGAHLPELADLQVIDPTREPLNGQAFATVPCERAMTVHDLLRHTSGLAYAFMGTHPLKRQYLERGVSDPSNTNQTHVERLAALPLLHQPGTTWEYSVATDVLGRVIEVVSGQTLDAFIRERITQPLQLHDTDFQAPERDADRIALPGLEGPQQVRPNIPLPTTAMAFKSGGGGMVSTAADYARLCQLWLNGGELDGVRLLSRKTLSLMTSDHLPPDARFGPEMTMFGTGTPSPEFGHGFGLGFSVRTHAGRSPMPGSVGTYAWSGIYGTSFWVDPQEELFCVLMLQSIAQRAVYRRLVQQLVYQALA